METNTELLNRIEAHIKGRLAVAESRAASSELYEGKKIAYNSILGFVKGLRGPVEEVPADVQEAANQYIGYPPEVDEGVSTSLRRQAFADGMLDERERLASCPAIKGWVARDENGQLWLYGQRPFRNETVWTTSNGRYFLRIDNTLFHSLRWEDEPIEVEIIVKTKQ